MNVDIKSGGISPFREFNGSQNAFPFLEKLRGEMDESARYLPYLRENSAALYSLLLRLKRPVRIFEAGTLYGYSALLAAFTLKSCGECDFKIITCELSEENAKIAADNFKKAGFDGQIEVITGDAAEVLQCLSGAFDLIFLDSAKGQYVNMLPDIKGHLADGGLLVCDDILYHELSGIPASEAPHKHRTIVNNLARFVDAIKNDGGFTGVIDSMDDGLLLAQYSRRDN
ncbi:MAG: O-methyltransferase [Clostridia bacterium]|nr:O-methyltransferase [Clostridia bacterium]